MSWLFRSYLPHISVTAASIPENRLGAAPVKSDESQGPKTSTSEQGMCLPVLGLDRWGGRARKSAALLYAAHPPRQTPLSRVAAMPEMGK